MTSNPSPEYVGRVAAVFADNGTGVRGDLKAVVAGHPDGSRGAARRRSGTGAAQRRQAQRAVLFITNLLRAMNGMSDGASLSDRASDMKQPPFFSPTVFNFYPPGSRDSTGTKLLGPEFEIFDTSTDIARINFVNTLVYGSVSGTTTVDLSGYVPLAANPDQLVTAVAAVMLHGQVSDRHAEHAGHDAFRNFRQHPAHQSSFLSDWQLIAVPGRTLKGEQPWHFHDETF